MRAQFQVLVFPYVKKEDKSFRYCIFKRKDMDIWQAISGGGEEGETPIEAAIRETQEEANIDAKNKIYQLTSTATIPVEFIRGFIWGEDVLVVPEYTFGVEVKDENIAIKEEHKEYIWGTYEEVSKKLQFDSNKTALWELNHRLLNNKIK